MMSSTRSNRSIDDRTQYKMTNRFFAYLEREQARLERLIADEGKRLQPDQPAIAGLRKQKRLVELQLAQWRADALLSDAA